MTTILIVDDDPFQASLLMSLLGAAIRRCVQRSTIAAEALCLIEQPEFANKLSLVIAGHHTPGSAALLLCAELRLPEAGSAGSGLERELVDGPSDYSGFGTSRLSSCPVLLAETRCWLVTSQILAVTSHAAVFVIEQSRSQSGPRLQIPRKGKVVSQITRSILSDRE